MGEKVYGFHAIEEALKKAGMGSTLYVQRQGGERIEALAREAKLTGKVAVKKLSKEEIARMMPGVDTRGAILDLGGPRRGASRLVELSVEEFCSSLKDDDGALVLILDGITDPHNLGAILRSADQFGVDLHAEHVGAPLLMQHAQKTAVAAAEVEHPLAGFDHVGDDFEVAAVTKINVQGFNHGTPPDGCAGSHGPSARASPPPAERRRVRSRNGFRRKRRSCGF